MNCSYEKSVFFIENKYMLINFPFNTIVTKNVEKHFFMTDYFVAILSGK